MATRYARRPIVLFTNDNDTTHVKDAVAAGVSAYIVAGLSPDRIRPILDVAMARFEHEQGLRQELAHAKTELQDRKVIDRAKGIIMQRQGLNEKAAYDKLRKAAMDKGLRLGEVAQCHPLRGKQVFGIAAVPHGEIEHGLILQPDTRCAMRG